jgi:hypothetical protein
MHPEAMMHVLNIIHMRNQKVPYKILLEVFAHIAIVADYYKTKHAFDLWVPQWLSRLPQNYIYDSRLKLQDNFLWLFIRTAFEHEPTFGIAAKNPLGHCGDFTQDLGLPLNAIMSRLFSHRLKVTPKLQAAINTLELRSKLGRGDRRVGCDANGCKELVATYIRNQRARVALLDREQGTSFDDLPCSMQQAGPKFPITRRRVRYHYTTCRHTPCCPVDAATPPDKLDEETDKDLTS